MSNKVLGVKYDEDTIVKVTKVGNSDAVWVEEVYPDYAINKKHKIGTFDGEPDYDYSAKPKNLIKTHFLIWGSNGVRYELDSVDQGFELSMKDAVKMAESFMEGQQ